jgi:hypothetical protein
LKTARSSSSPRLKKAPPAGEQVVVLRSAVRPLTFIERSGERVGFLLLHDDRPGVPRQPNLKAAGTVEADDPHRLTLMLGFSYLGLRVGDDPTRVGVFRVQAGQFLRRGQDSLLSAVLVQRGHLVDQYSASPLRDPRLLRLLKAGAGMRVGRIESGELLVRTTVTVPRRRRTATGHCHKGSCRQRRSR